MRIRTATVAATLVAATVTPLSLSIGPASAAPAEYADDFNGDGYRDYATFSYGPEGASKGGGILVTFGTATGAPGTKTQFIDQAGAGVPGTDETDDFFGEYRTAADFNGDGYGDLAVSANGENVGKYKDNGTVTVLWGGAKGLSGGTTVPDKGPKGVSGRATDLATGDFNGDGKQDLALVRDSKTYVYRGSIGKSGVKGSVTVLDKDNSSFYSTAVITGKVDKDGKTDLVIIGDVVTDKYIASDAWFIKGGKAKLYPGKTLRLESVKGNGGQADRGGDGVIADFDKDGYGDIAIGTPLYDKYRGRVTVWYGAASGPSSQSARFTQATKDIKDTPEVDDSFGASVSAGDVNGDGYRDLAIGAYGERLGNQPYAGAVHVLYGTKSGLTAKGSQWFARNTPGVPGGLDDDSFGGTVRLRDTNGDGKADLHVTANYGSVVLRGSASGVTTAGVESVNGEIVAGMLQ
ncbi:FG-GAP repeat protein [Streptomyces graminofaciens]|uniref:FG-GAP repeat protein n=1 Tax=Streptomyces graminofaciens TaxID=68212 RepID=A0ABM7FG61_9ACTN|nr:FG-GAP and VCBS repeat-containing protein [Streptomyces graminofaciens]BBC35178.1 FG-GAP repeat protein [Streptomyces graminofaciens]